MQAVNEIISILERINITKELLETTRLGKHVNELRRKTSEPTLARRAKVLVKRWRDLVIPTVASPNQTGSNRSSAERQVRRLGGTPLTSPALSRNAVSPAVPSPRPVSRQTWGGYESDSQDVILVDDDPPSNPALAPPLLNIAQKPLTPPVKRPPSSEPLYDEKKAKRDKKPKKRRGHGRAGSGAESSAGPSPAPAGAGTGVGVPAAWGVRNGAGAAPPTALAATAPAAGPGAAAGERRARNGCRRDALDPYAALATRMPPAGGKKVKTTKELLEQIQSRGTKPASSAGSPASPRSPASPASPDVMLIEPDSVPIKVDSPLRNGGSSPPPLPAAAASPARARSPMQPLEDEREYVECTCGTEEDALDPECPAAARGPVLPLHVRALHNTLVPGVNGTRAPLHPHQFAVRKPEHADWPGLFASVVPLYKYSDYADDYCAKNMAAVPLCTHLPWTEFAPPPPDLPPPPEPPPLRPYPIDDEVEVKAEPKEEGDDESEDAESKPEAECPKMEPEMIGVPSLEPSERLKAPILSAEDETQFGKSEPGVELDVQDAFKTEPQEHRTVERTKEEPLDGRALHAECVRCAAAVRYDYAQLQPAPVLALPAAEAALAAALAAVDAAERDALCRPARPPRFAEWHECARLGDLVALPYVVID
ncbi:WAS/WASL-interacting protein family member 1 isoform X2 [Manduca sexta]|nr:WAS/WASL-interacting protein family member 1 isoform X2 [Manduca sexta]